MLLSMRISTPLLSSSFYLLSDSCRLGILVMEFLHDAVWALPNYTCTICASRPCFHLPLTDAKASFGRLGVPTVDSFIGAFRSIKISVCVLHPGYFQIPMEENECRSHEVHPSKRVGNINIYDFRCLPLISSTIGMDNQCEQWHPRR
jgi:hypothetical protein